MKTLRAANYVIKEFGGAAVLARLLDVDISTVSQWRCRGGRIPSAKQAKILRFAKKLNLNVTPEHIIYGTCPP